jgi:acetoacetyl-CoA synthetase
VGRAEHRVTEGELLWTPSPGRVAAARMTAFRHVVTGRHDVQLADFSALQGFALDRPDDFWSAVWDFTGVVGDKGGHAFVDATDIRDARFFPGASLNVAETMLARADDVPALLFAREDGKRSVTTWAQLRRDVAAVAYALLDAGVQPGDVVAAWLPNIPEAYVTALATASIGAMYTSTSPDFGSSGVLDRFGQVRPKVLVATDGYLYGGRAYDCLDRLKQICAGLPTVRTVVVVPGLTEARDVSALGAVLWSDFAKPTDAPPPFRRLPFDAPLYVLYSSGTTGPPKCIVHKGGGVMLSLVKEHQLHCDIKPADRVFYYTTTGWMMWNWLAGALASQATVVVYDGSPVHPSPSALFDLIDELGITLFGTSAKFLDTARKSGLSPASGLPSLRTITSTGSPLSPDAFEYVYAKLRDDVHLASISGGTDICGCFVMGDPTRPVYSGEIQGPALGMAVEIFDDEGKPVPDGVTGELVCTRPFPSMPLGLWADDGGAAYNAAYFADYPGVWRHGDWVARTPHRGFVIAGRSDATLNPGGVRIGTAEIYRQVDQLPEVVESVVIGQRQRDDVRIVLFVHLVDGVELDDDLSATIRSVIRQGCSPRHVPAVILSVPEVPRTRSGKLVELAVRDVVEDRNVRNVEALANPESLEHFRGRPELS